MDLHALAEKMAADSEGGAQQFRQLFVLRIQDGPQLIALRQFSVEGFIRQYAEIHASSYVARF
jgi:hypothetical protein